MFDISFSVSRFWAGFGLGILFTLGALFMWGV